MKNYEISISCKADEKTGKSRTAYGIKINGVELDKVGDIDEVDAAYISKEGLSLLRLSYVLLKANKQLEDVSFVEYMLNAVTVGIVCHTIDLGYSETECEFLEQLRRNENTNEK